ncbi:hypothetical protein PFISCL1PPCAC_23384, partial [Pristionchus fissidentatus]
YLFDRVCLLLVCFSAPRRPLWVAVPGRRCTQLAAQQCSQRAARQPRAEARTANRRCSPYYLHYSSSSYRSSRVDQLVPDSLRSEYEALSASPNRPTPLASSDPPTLSPRPSRPAHPWALWP